MDKNSGTSCPFAIVMNSVESGGSTAVMPSASRSQNDVSTEVKTIELIRAEQIDAALVNRWNELLGSREQLTSPYLLPQIHNGCRRCSR